MICKKGCGGSPHRNPLPLYNPDRNAIEEIGDWRLVIARS
jgi:hypothetical protein